MPRYSLAVAGAATNGIGTKTLATLHTGANLQASIVEIHVTQEGLHGGAGGGRLLGDLATNTPVATTSVLGLAENPSAPASTVNVDTAWSTPPTVSAGGVYFKRWVMSPTAGTQGQGAIHVIPGGLIIPVNGWFVIWNDAGAAGAATSICFVWDE